jgi:hypothetical protein
MFLKGLRQFESREQLRQPGEDLRNSLYGPGSPQNQFSVKNQYYRVGLGRHLSFSTPMHLQITVLLQTRFGLEWCVPTVAPI